MPIFIDESGFTGNNLLDANQPYFVMSSVSISDDEAQGLVDKVRADFKIKADELKGANLLRTPRGRDVVKYILYNIQGKYALSANHKSYALCCKFFEYVFEPVLQKNNMLFYNNNFHFFIAGTLFFFSSRKNTTAFEIMESFSTMIRARDFDALRAFFSNKTSPLDGVFIDMISFMEGYSDAIIEELDTLKITTSGGKWTLDLSISTLHSLLRHWAKSHDEMTVICDPSKPLAALAPDLDIMIGRTDRPQHFHPVAGRYCPIFNLKRSVQFKDSKESAGIQLADIVASFAADAFKKDDKSLLQIIAEGVIGESIFPTLEYVNLTEKQPFLNALVLKELANRARNKSDPLSNMAAYYEFISEQYDTLPPETK